MSDKLPAPSGRDIIRALRRADFSVDRVKGSHHILVHRTDKTRFVVVPVHGNRAVKRGTLANILKQAKLSAEEFGELL